MLRRHYSLILAAVWIGMGVCLVWPDILPERARGHLKGIGGFVGVLAFMLAAYNVVRWQATQSLYRNRVATARTVNPLAVRKVEPEPERYEPNPELNFIKLPEDETPKDDTGR